MDEPVPDIPAKPPRRQYRKWGLAAEVKLARIKAIRAAAEARRDALAKARRDRVAAAQRAAKTAQRALDATLKKMVMPDPEDTPERQASRAAARKLAGQAKGKVKIPGRKRGGSIDAADVALILRLRQKEATQVEIAKVMNVSPETVARALAEFGDTRPLAKAYLQNQAEQIAKHAVDASKIASMNGKADASLELLDRLDVAPKRVDVQDNNKVVIIVGSASQSALPSLPFLLPDATTPD